MRRCNAIAAAGDQRASGAWGEWHYPLHMGGMATTLPLANAEPRDYGAELRAVYREVSGRDDAPEPTKPRIGFLP